MNKESFRQILTEFFDAIDKHNADRKARVEKEGTDFEDYQEPTFENFIKWIFWDKSTTTQSNEENVK